MREVMIYERKDPRSSRSGSRHLHAVIDEMTEILSQKARVYRTFTEMDEKEHTLVTTSKDVHLSLGRMSDSGQHHFAELLLEEFAAGNCSELLVLEPQTKKGLLATLQYKHSDGRGSVIHLSPAH